MDSNLSGVEISREQSNALIQDMLDKAFKDTDLTPDDVKGIEMRANTVPFPRSLYCKCKRCISQYQEWSISYYNVILETNKGPYYGVLPGPKDAFAHPVQWKED
jgi:hypothetical protein